jgi:K+-sensing histidine kinase KdpD
VRTEAQRLFQKERELEAARRISEALFQHTRVDKLIENALHTALDVVRAEAGSLLLANSESQQLIFQHSVGVRPVLPGTAIPWDYGIVGAVFHSGEPAVIENVKADARHFAGIDELTGYSTRDMITLPLKRWEGEPIGVITILNKREGQLDKDDLSILTIISSLTATAIEQARLYEEAKLAEVVRLLGDIGHDVRNMLAPVIMGAGILHEELDALFSRVPTPPDEKASERCHMILGMLRNAARRIQDRVKEIADCVKGLSCPPRFENCRLMSVSQNVLDTLRMVAEEKCIALRCEGLDALPPILADEQRLYNALYNLINNAISEVSRGGSITIRGRIAPEPDFIVISVIDTGRGMPPEIRDSLFTGHAISRKPRRRRDDISNSPSAASSQPLAIDSRTSAALLPRKTLCRGVHQRKRYGKRRPLRFMGVNLNLSCVLCDYPTCNGESKTCPFSLFLCRKKRIENFRYMRGRNTGT